MSGLRALVITLVVVGLAGVQGAWLTGQFEAYLDPLARKYAAADVVQYYAVRPDRSVRLKIPPDTQRLKLVTHGVLPAGDRPTPNEPRSYGVRLRLQGPGGELHWTREVWLQSRQSVAPEEQGARQNAFLAQDDPRQLTDDRLLFLSLDTPLPSGGVLAVEQAPTENVEAVVLRAYGVDARHPVRLRLQAHAGAPEVQAAIERLSLRPWGRLPIEEREAAARDTHDRLHALGRAHVDFKTTAVWYTGHREVRAPASAGRWPGFVVSARRKAAINVIGPFTVMVKVRAEPHPDALPSRARLWISAVDGRQESAVAEFPVSPDGEALDYAFEIPGGVQSLHFTTDREAGVEVDVLAPAVGARLLADRPPLRVDDERVRLLPDERHVPVALLHADGWLAHYHLAPTGDARRVVRVDTRRVATPLRWSSALAPDDHALVPTMLQITWLDAEGDPLLSSTPTDDAPLAPFESVEVVRAGHHVSEPTRRYLVVPEEARTLLLGSDAPVVGRVYAAVPENEREYRAPYAEFEPTETRWRYAPPLRDRWFPLTPDNQLALEETGQWSTLRAQVRLEPRTPDPDAGRLRAGTTLDPVGWTQQRKIIEPIGARTPKAADFERFLVTRLQPNRATPLRFLPSARRAARVHYRVVGRGAMGRRVLFVVDGKTVEQTRVRASAGTWRLPPVEPGDRAVEVRGPDGLELFVDKPPQWSGGKAIHAIRTVHRLTEAGLAVDVDHTLPATRVGVVAYAPEQAGVPDVFIAAELDGGRPPRAKVAADRHTVPARRHPLPPAKGGVARFLNHRGPALGRSRAVGFPIWDDVRPGRRRLHVHAEGRELWVRFYVLDRTSGPSEGHDVSLKILAEAE